MRGKHHLFRALDILVWTLSKRNTPTRDEIVERWGVSKSSAWRWKLQLDVIHSLYTINRRVNP